MSSETFDSWAILELLGHVRIAGKVSEAELFGQKLGRIDIPTYRPCSCPNAVRTSATGPTVPCEQCHGSGQIAGFTTQFFGGSSVYRLTPCGEEEARAVAARAQPQPVHVWEMPRALPDRARDEEEREDDQDEVEQPF